MNGFDSYRVRERADIARVVLLAAFLVLGGAFFRTQVIQHEKFQLRAETNRLRPIPLTPPRGTILDRKGEIIAENVPGYSVKVLAPSVDSLRALLARVGRFVPRPPLTEVVDGARGVGSDALGYNASFVYPREGGIDRGLVVRLDGQRVDVRARREDAQRRQLRRRELDDAREDARAVGF